MPILKVRDAPQVLVARPGFKITRGVCYTCGTSGDVMAFIRRP